MREPSCLAPAHLRSFMILKIRAQGAATEVVEAMEVGDGRVSIE